MSQMPTYSQATEAAAVIRAIAPEIPTIAVVLGSGLRGLVDRLKDKVILPYLSIPHVASPTVAGHAGNVVLGRLDSARLIALQGRSHHFEGHDLEAVTFPVRVLQR